MKQKSLVLELPDGVKRSFDSLALDFTGTQALDGVLLPGVSERLVQLAEAVRIRVLTADTFGTAAEQLKNLPVEVSLIQKGGDKAEAVKKLGGGNVIAVGNGRNDVSMLKEAGLGIAVIGPEGASAELLRAADVVVVDICNALDLLIHPLRLKATLRD